MVLKRTVQYEGNRTIQTRENQTRTLAKPTGKTPGRAAIQLEDLFLGTDFPKFWENWNFFQKNTPVTFLTL